MAAMSITRRPNSPYWWVDIQPTTGARVRKSTGFTDKKEAQRFHDELKASLWSVPRSKASTWDKACLKWLTEGTRSAPDRYMVRAIGAIPNVTQESFNRVLAGRKAGTYNRYVSLINAILNLSKINVKLAKKPVPKGRLIFLTTDEWERLHQELPEHLKPIAAFALYTGLRQSNVTQLEWSRVDLKRAVMWIDAPDMKGKKSVGIPLSDKAVALLESQPREKTFVFLYRGKPIKKIKKAWHNACIRAGLGKRVEGGYSGFTFHGLRHTWASWHVMAGTSLEVLKDLGAWSDLQMVLTYAHLAPDHLKQYANNSVPYSVPQPSKKAAF